MTAVRTHSTRRLLEVSAVTYLVLGVAFGPHFVFSLVMFAAVVALWVVAARRFRIFGAFSHGFTCGHIGSYHGRRSRRW
jgi:hypothetical protein